MATLIQLTRGKVAVIDDGDASLVTGGPRWRAVPSHRKDGTTCWYAGRTVALDDGRHSTEYMHRLIVGARKAEEVDHRDHDGLNNRRSNLRRCSRTQNQINVRTSGGACGFRGVEYRPAQGYYRAAVTLHRRKHYAGNFPTAEAAAAAYDALALSLHGEFAVLNFPARKAA